MQHPRVAIVDYIISVDLFLFLQISCVLSLSFTWSCFAVLLMFLTVVLNVTSLIYLLWWWMLCYSDLDLHVCSQIWISTFVAKDCWWLALRVSWLVAYSPNSSQNGFCETNFLRLLPFEDMESVCGLHWTALATIGRENNFFQPGWRISKTQKPKLCEWKVSDVAPSILVHLLPCTQ